MSYQSSSLIKLAFGYYFFLFMQMPEFSAFSSIYFLDGDIFFYTSLAFGCFELYSLTSYFCLFQFYFRICQAFAFNPPPCLPALNPPFSFYSIFLRICNFSSVYVTLLTQLSLKSYQSELFFAPLSAHYAISPIYLSISIAFFSGSAFLLPYGLLPRLCTLDTTLLDAFVIAYLFYLGCDFYELVDEALFNLPTNLDSAPKLRSRKSSSIYSWYLLSRTLLFEGLVTTLLFQPNYRPAKSSPNMDRERLRGLEQSSSAILQQKL